MSTVTESPYITFAEVRNLLRCSSAALVKWVRNGTICPPIRIGNKRLWLRSDLDAFLAQAKEAPRV
jgi:excisionase family DNA binding protein